MKHNAFICSPIIVEIEIYDEGSPSLKKVKFNQNQLMNEEINVFEGRGRGRGEDVPL